MRERKEGFEDTQFSRYTLFGNTHQVGTSYIHSIFLVALSILYILDVDVEKEDIEIGLTLSLLRSTPYPQPPWKYNAL